MAKAELDAVGFKSIQRSKKRLIASIQGLRKSGKTRLALTAPKPLGYIALEIGGEEGVADQFIPEGFDENPDIQIVTITLPPPNYPDRASFGTRKESDKEFNDAVSVAVQESAEIALNNFYNAYYASINNMRTTVIDTGTDLWELIRLANFGRLEKIPTLSYGQINKIMDTILQDAAMASGNLLITHHMKEKWIQVLNEKTGNMTGVASGVYEMAGYGGIPKKVQAVIELWRENLTEPCEITELMVRFNGEVTDSRHSPRSMGKKVIYDFTFTDVAKLIVGGSAKDWE